ncbi:MAG: sensor histidine kinase [Silicimonas sp.]|nr:sensor histidine kinase [Silicimonas sp.]
MRSLPVRLAALMTLALLPLGLIAIWQTREVVENSAAAVRAAVMAETERAAASERKVLERVSGYAVGLGAGLGGSEIDRDACTRIFTDFVADRSSVVFAGYIDTQGVMQCSSTGSVVDISDTDLFERARARGGPVFEVSPAGATLDDASVVINAPVFVAGEIRGYVWISIVYELARQSRILIEDDIRVDYLLLNRDGTTLRTGNGQPTAPFFIDDNGGISRLFARSGTTFLADSNSGERRLYAVSPFISDTTIVVGSMPFDRDLSSLGVGSHLLTLVFPVLMWVAGIAVALFGLHRLVNRHVFDLRRAMRSFAGGERRDVILTFDDPPEEFHELQDSYNDLVQRLASAEEKADEDLQEKTMLLREVHHRVKNNLQLIASIMNMHGRIAQTPEARRLLGQLQRRVRGLATVHRTLDSTTRRVAIDSRTLIEQLLRDLVPPASADDMGIALSADAIEVALGHDQAIALSMLVAEAISNAVTYAGAPEGEQPAIHVVFAETATGDLMFSVENTVAPDPAPGNDCSSTGIGYRLIQAFVAQLEGTQTTEHTDTMYRFEVRFPSVAFDPDATAFAPGPDIADHDDRQSL